ncbi:hypothetical protein RFI_30439 [Reticulomyxa filosa]|uniref:Uncharacterized protein n=1 Tax=Reticulomyxa filosa TaxID=46433 RepID=X6M1V4_RETFI|nr:hypothetical protein RFI_30439 [Reticulomyxa filosa]|eukprot:ETO06955.1 hypothetical protein RFI_30439 [Reticulomyxa filosa]
MIFRKVTWKLLKYKINSSFHKHSVLSDQSLLNPKYFDFINNLKEDLAKILARYDKYFSHWKIKKETLKFALETLPFEAIKDITISNFEHKKQAYKDTILKGSMLSVSKPVSNNDLLLNKITKTLQVNDYEVRDFHALQQKEDLYVKKLTAKKDIKLSLRIKKRKRALDEMGGAVITL